MTPSGIITLLTDFGTRDGYVGAMKGVVLSLFPSAVLVDLTHEIEPGDVAGAAYALATASPEYPGGTVHVAVVDPGVGTARRSLIVETSTGALLVGPDNGVLSLAAGRARRVFDLDRPRWFGERLSATFHGRDVFAPVAAHAASGIALEQLGTPCDAMVELHWPAARREGDLIRGAVVHVDRFGNLITNITRADVEALGEARMLAVEISGRLAAFHRTFASAEPGTLIAVLGSGDAVEVAVTEGSAAALLGVGSGTAVTVDRRP